MEENGSLVIPSFEHPDLIAGQGTTGLEIIDELPEADAILVPTDGGGLLAGVAIALSHRKVQTQAELLTRRATTCVPSSRGLGSMTLSTPCRDSRNISRSET